MLQKGFTLGDDQHAVAQSPEQPPVMRIVTAVGIDVTLKADINMSQRFRTGFFQVDEHFQIRAGLRRNVRVRIQLVGFDQRVDRQEEALRNDRRD